MHQSGDYGPGNAVVFLADAAFVAIGVGGGLAVDIGVALSQTSRWWLIAPPIIGGFAGYWARKLLLPA